MADRVLGRGRQPGTKVPEIVGVGAGDDGGTSSGERRNRRVEIRLAEVAAIDRIGDVARIDKLARVDPLEPPSLAPRVPFDTLGRIGGDGGGDCVDHVRRIGEHPVRDDGEGHAVDAPAHRHRDAAHVPEHLFERSDSRTRT